MNVEPSLAEQLLGPPLKPRLREPTAKPSPSLAEQLLGPPLKPGPKCGPAARTS